MSYTYKEHVIKQIEETINLDKLPFQLIFFRSYSKKEKWALSKREAREIKEHFSEKGITIELENIKLAPFTKPFWRKEFSFNVISKS